MGLIIGLNSKHLKTESIIQHLASLNFILLTSHMADHIGLVESVYTSLLKRLNVQIMR